MSTPFGSMVREARTARGLTLAQLGGLVGTDHSRISRIENGKARLAADEVAALVRVLDLSAADALAAVEAAWPAQPTDEQASAQLVEAVA